MATFPIRQTAIHPASPGGRRDYRLRALLALVGGVIVLGWVVTWMPGRSVIAERLGGESIAPSIQSPRSSSFTTLQPSGASGREQASEELVVLEPKSDAGDPKDASSQTLLKDAAKAIRAKRYDAALAMLDQARPGIQKYPESYLLVGRALEGKKDHATARDFYNAALNLDPLLPEAYWGMATTSEALGDLETALGGMRSFLHTVKDPDPFRLKVAQARSAIWEWEASLGRGPWGPTKGIIPGLTPEQAKKDGRGVGIMMPLPGTEQPDGSKKFEIKHQDKFEMFKK